MTATLTPFAVPGERSTTLPIADPALDEPILSEPSFRSPLMARIIADTPRILLGELYIKMQAGYPLPRPRPWRQDSYGTITAEWDWEAWLFAAVHLIASPKHYQHADTIACLALLHGAHVLIEGRKWADNKPFDTTLLHRLEAMLSATDAELYSQ